MKLPGVSRLPVRAGAFGLFVLAAAQPGGAEPYLEIDKSERRMLLKEGDSVIREFRVALGRDADGGAKHSQGDKRTPEGEYTVIAINPGSRYGIFFHLSYPNAQDVEEGFRRGLIDSTTRAAMAREIAARGHSSQTTALGGYVGIHATHRWFNWVGRLHSRFDWTLGCIAVTRAEVDALRKRIRTGTRVVIRA